jgi:hypothetical protein
MSELKGWELVRCPLCGVAVFGRLIAHLEQDHEIPIDLNRCACGEVMNVRDMYRHIPHCVAIVLAQKG